MIISYTEAIFLRMIQVLEAKGLLKDGRLTAAADAALAERDKIDKRAQEMQFANTIR